MKLQSTASYTVPDGVMRQVPKYPFKQLSYIVDFSTVGYPQRDSQRERSSQKTNHHQLLHTIIQVRYPGPGVSKPPTAITQQVHPGSSCPCQGIIPFPRAPAAHAEAAGSPGKAKTSFSTWTLLHEHRGREKPEKQWRETLRFNIINNSSTMSHFQRLR